MKKIFLLLGLIILVLCSCSKQQPAKNFVVDTPVEAVEDATTEDDTVVVEESDEYPEGISYEMHDSVEIFHGNKGTIIKCIHSGDSLLWYYNNILRSVEVGTIQIFYSDKGKEEIFPRLNY